MDEQDGEHQANANAAEDQQKQLCKTSSGNNDSSGIESDIGPNPALSGFGDGSEDASPIEIIFEAI